MTMVVGPPATKPPTRPKSVAQAKAEPQPKAETKGEPQPKLELPSQTAATSAAQTVGFQSPAPQPAGLILLGGDAKPAAQPAAMAEAVAASRSTPVGSENSTNRASAAPRPQLEVAAREAVTHRCGRDVESASASDPNVCKVVRVDSRNVAVLGVRDGAASVELTYADGTSESLAVEVRSGRAADGGDKIASVLESLKQMYPAAGLEIRAKGAGHLRVTGTAKSEAEARQIVSLVRKVFLMPVEDGVGVAGR